MIQLNGISKHFGVQVLFDDINLLIGKGERIGFVGRNGSGKSTLFKIILGEMTPDSGNIKIPNGEFDEFNTTSYEVFKDWYMSEIKNAQLGRTTSNPLESIVERANTGKYAMRLITSGEPGFVFIGQVMAIPYKKKDDYFGMIDYPFPMFAVDKKYMRFSLDYKYNKSFKMEFSS